MGERVKRLEEVVIVKGVVRVEGVVIGGVVRGEGCG